MARIPRDMCSTGKTAFHGASIAPSFTGERNLPNMSKTTLDFLICQGEEGKAHRAWRMAARA